MERTVRLAQPGDAAACLDIYRPIVEETATSFETEVPSQAEFTARVTATMRTHPWLVCCDGGTVVGYAYGTVHRARAAYRWSAEVSAYVGESARGTGAGRLLYQRLFDCLRLQRFASAFAGITLPNPASVAFHRALGFQTIGVFPRIGYKFGRWHDVGWYSLWLGGPDAPPEPRPLPECRVEIERVLAGTEA